ncbi:MAG: hypothetical protein CL885_01705 [Dehalococcoidia bacterium]|nr:hypothetical protein [Dehalococcoidia bacterium]
MDFSDFIQPGIVSVTGKPGAGKSYFSVKVVLEELKKDNPRTIVTNVPLNVPKIKKHVGKPVEIYGLATFTDNRFFFTQRGHYEFQVPSEENIDFSQYLQDDDKGVLYIIDEAHLYFNSRNWKDLAKATLSYFTFIRHIGDTLLYLTQKYADVDAQLRGKTQTFNLIRNLSRERFLKYFKRGSGFRAYQYLNEEDIRSKDKASQDFTYNFEKKVARLYSTSIFNKETDVRTKVKGIPITWALLALALVAGSGVYWLYTYGFSNILANVFTGFVSTEAHQISTEKKAEKPKQQFSQGGSVTNPSVNGLSPTGGINEFPDQVFTGFPRVLNEQHLQQKPSEVYQGTSVISTIDVITQNKQDDKNRSVDLEMSFSEFFDVPFVAFNLRGGIQSRDFNAFVNFFDNFNQSSTVSQIQCILKENAEWTFNQGLEIPVARTVATQGVAQTNYDFKQLGFTVQMVYQKVEDIYLLRYQITQSSIMQTEAEVPTLQNSQVQSVLQFLPSRTYLLAEFEERRKTKQEKKLLAFKSKDQEQENIVKTQVFIRFNGEI